MAISGAKGKQRAVYCAGWGFIALGLLGLVLPILQGILFLLAGLTLLSSSSPHAERILNSLRRRFPKLSHTCDQAARRAKKVRIRIGKHIENAKTQGALRSQ
jgi:uncharacterized membrane protein YbaN (DUF454 family)